MTRERIIDLLKTWHRAILASTDLLQKIYDVAGRDPESPIATAIYGLESAYTETIERLIVGTAEFAWLDWYRFETSMGAVPKQIGISPDTDIVVQSIESLADLLLCVETRTHGQGQASTAGESPLSTVPEQRHNTHAARIPMTDGVGQFDIIAGIHVAGLPITPFVSPPDNDVTFPQPFGDTQSVTLAVMHRGKAVSVTVAIRLELPPDDTSTES